MLYTRMLFSCLVDADYLDTAAFMRPEEVREEAPPIEKLWESVEMQDVNYGHPATTLDERRTQILRACLDVAGRTEDSVFTLTVPTGGGKTFASLAFAMRLALRRGMKRIIYVIPYTSITLQTAEVFRKIFGDNIVLEDHCQASWKSQDAQDVPFGQAVHRRCLCERIQSVAREREHRRNHRWVCRPHGRCPL